MAISEACKFETKDEVDQMVDRGDTAIRSPAFDAMVEFCKAIGIEINLQIVERKSFRAALSLTNAGIDETATTQKKKVRGRCVMTRPRAKGERL